MVRINGYHFPPLLIDDVLVSPYISYMFGSSQLLFFLVRSHGDLDRMLIQIKSKIKFLVWSHTYLQSHTDAS